MLFRSETKDFFANLILFIEEIKDKTIKQLKKLDEQHKESFEVQNMLIKRYLNDVTNLQDYYDYGKYLDQKLQLPIFNLNLPSVDDYKKEFQTLHAEICKFDENLSKLQETRNSLNFKPKYNQVLVPYGNSIRVCDQSLNEVKMLNGHTNGVLCLVRVNEDLIASGSKDKSIKIWDMRTGQCIQTLNGHTHYV